MTGKLLLLTFLSSAATVAHAWVSSSSSRSSSSGSLVLNAEQRSSSVGAVAAESSRGDFLKAVGLLGVSSVVAVPGVSFAADDAPSSVGDQKTFANGVKCTVKSVGTGPKPDVGELVAIRFAAFAGDNKIDDIFATPEPYYTRVGSGGLIKGVEQTLPLMTVGDRWELVIPGNLAFGSQGRKASAGRPRIPPDATIIFDVEVVGLPGREVELIELIGDD